VLRKVCRAYLGTVLLSVSLVGAEVELSYELVPDLRKVELLSPAMKGQKTAKLKLSNGIQVYCIHDPKTPIAAAALAVENGSWSDPEEYPGMAHFCEHMLFMGSGAYPKENEVWSYMADHAGNTNAYTATDRTVYMFSIENSAFPGAFDRFSHFFIDPLFSPSCVGRELLAVNQEFAKNIEHDGWRQYQVLKETGNPLHPHAGFSTGTAETLSKIPYEELKRWFEAHYTPEEMRAVLYSSLPLPEMIDLAATCLGQVPQRAHSQRYIDQPLSSEKQVGHLLYLKPVRDLKQLSLIWEVPEEYLVDLDCPVANLVTYAIGHGGDKSLEALLKRQGLALSVGAGGEKLSRDQGLFSIEIELTDEGIQQREKVIETCFAAIARLKQQSIPRYLFDEMQKIALLQYQYPSQEEPFHLVSGHVADMLYEPFSTYPERTRLPSHYSTDAIDGFIDNLTPEACIFVLTASPEIAKWSPNRRETWMGAEYRLDPISEEKLLAWAAMPPHPEVELPQPNPFMPQKVLLYTTTQEEKPRIEGREIASSALGSAYCCQDRYYLVPEVAYSFSVTSPLFDGSSKSRVLQDLMLEILDTETSQLRSYGEAAHLHAESGVHKGKLYLKIEGCSEGANAFSEKMLLALRSLTPSNEEFDRIRTSLASRYRNQLCEIAFFQGIEAAADLILPDAPTSQEKLSQLEQLSHEQFLASYQEMLAQSHLEAFFYGNLEEPEARDLWQRSMTIWQSAENRGYPSDTMASRRAFPPPADGPFLLSFTTPMQGGATLLLLYEGAFSFPDKAAAQLLSPVLRERFFATLRTKQQTGYIAKSWEMEEGGELFRWFGVQSSTHQPRDLLARFDLFLEEMEKGMEEEISKERFAELKKTAIQQLTTPAENLSAHGDLLYTLAFDFRGDFARLEKRVSALEKLSYEQFIAFAKKSCARSNSRRIAILIEGSKTEGQFSYNPLDLESAKNWKSLR